MFFLVVEIVAAGSHGGLYADRGGSRKIGTPEMDDIFDPDPPLHPFSGFLSAFHHDYDIIGASFVFDVLDLCCVIHPGYG